MAFVEASTTAANRVRLLVGDISTSTASEFLHDGAYTFFVNNTPNIWAAACLAANTLAAKFQGLAGSSFEEKQVGDLRLKKGQVQGLAQGYRALCDHLRVQSAIASATPYAGGISRDDKDTVVSNTDRVSPAFTRGLFKNPLAVSPTQASTST